MNQETRYSVLVAAVLAVMLAGCNKKEEAPPAPTTGSEAPASQAAPTEPPSMPETGASGMESPTSPPPENVAPDAMPGGAAPAQ